MITRKLGHFTLVLLALAVVALLPTWAAAAQGTHRSDSELKRDLRDTEREFKQYKSLKSKLESSAKQSSNTARETAIHNFQDFMGECIRRREGELGEEITLKQHGKMVKSGTTKVAEVGSPVPVKKSAKGLAVHGTTNSDRLQQLSNMKTLYVSSKNNSRPAIERQEGAFGRYTETIDKFGHQLEWAIDGLTQELAQREAAAQEKQQ